MVPLKEQQAPAQGPALAKDQLQTLLVRDTTFELILGSPMAVPMECQYGCSSPQYINIWLFHRKYLIHNHVPHSLMDINMG